MDNNTKPDGIVKANIHNMKRRQPLPLPEYKAQNGLVYRLGKETETYHVEIEEPTLGKYGQLLKKYLHQNDRKVCRLLVQQQYWTFLEEQGERLDSMYERMMLQMRERGREPESYEERVRWLNQASQTVHELVMEELNQAIASVG